jgi:hypothetical protein
MSSAIIHAEVIYLVLAWCVFSVTVEPLMPRLRRRG